MLTDTLLTIIDRNADGILVVDEDGVIRFVNPAAEAIFGQSADALNGAMFGAPLVGGETIEVEILRRGTGENVSVEMRAVEVEWLGSRAYLASLRDITERRRSQSEIALRNRAIESSGSGIMILDARSDSRAIVYANAALTSITGYEPEVLLDRDCRLLWECSAKAADTSALDEALRLGYPCEAVIQCERSGGEPYWAEVRLSPIRDDAGSLTHFVGVLHDLTDRVYLEAERIEKEKISVALEKERELRELKDRFLSMMSHELRTPLALIRLSHDMLRQYGDKASDDERLQYLDSIRAQVEHLTDIIADVMAISRADSNQYDFAPEVIDLITYCRDIVEEFQLNYRNTHIVDFQCGVPIIRAPIDRKLMRQALTNLLSNAIKYSPNGSPVELLLRANGKHAIIRIRDHGIGIAPDDLKRLFEPFHRGGNVDTIPGTGLGLTIAHRAIKLHGGSIACESQLDQGTTFTIKLPMVTPIS